MRIASFLRSHAYIALASTIGLGGAFAATFALGRASAVHPKPAPTTSRVGSTAILLPGAGWEPMPFVTGDSGDAPEHWRVSDKSILVPPGTEIVIRGFYPGGIVNFEVTRGEGAGAHGFAEAKYVRLLLQPGK